MKAIRKFAIWSSLTVLVVVSAAIYTFFWIFEYDCNLDNWPNDEFRSASWLELTPENRFRQVKSIIESERILKSDRTEVRSLMGSPDNEGERYIGYVVRYFGESRCGMNSIAYIQFHFDLNDKVERIFVGFD